LNVKSDAVLDLEKKLAEKTLEKKCIQCDHFKICSPYRVVSNYLKTFGPDIDENVLKVLGKNTKAKDLPFIAEDLAKICREYKFIGEVRE
jgi:hypothetical protein